MAKLKYPSNGIYNTIRTELNDSLSHLNNASKNADYKVPGNFTYKSYMNSLKQTLKDYAKEIDNINDAVIKTNKTYEELEAEMNEKAKVINGYKVVERDRMIY